MANIDISKIEGYDKMTAEEKVAALEAYNFENTGSDTETEKLRKALTKANSEAADYKKKYQEKLTAEELQKLESEKAQKELQEKYDALLRSQTIGEYAAKFREQGYDEKLALETATALFEGDTNKVFENQKKFQTELEKTIRADITKNTPKPNNGGEGGVIRTREDILKIQDAAERQQAIADNIELFEGE